MKVLWLSPSPSLAENHLNDKPVSSGWIKSLEKGVREKVDLSVAFFYDGNVEPFTLDKTTYYPIRTFKKGKIDKIKRRILNTLESKEDLDQFLKVIETVQPDIIHIHGTEGPFGIVQKYTDVPCVVSIQGIIQVVLYRYFSGITFFQTMRYSKIKDWLLFRTFIHNYYEYRKTAVRERELFKLSKHMIGRTAWDNRVSRVLAPDSAYFHNDEILRDVFYARSWDNELKGKIRLLTTTGPVVYKGLETVLRCAYQLDLQNIDYEWDLAGVAPDDAAVKIAEKSVGKERGRNVRFLGRLNEEEMVAKLLAAHIYVGASHIENSPNSLCEAQILGVPCIATYAGGTGSLISDRVDGLVIQDGDPYVMAGAVKELISDYAKARQLAANGRKRALRRHDPNKITEELIDIYKDILGIKNPEEKESLNLESTPN